MSPYSYMLLFFALSHGLLVTMLYKARSCMQLCESRSQYLVCKAPDYNRPMAAIAIFSSCESTSSSAVGRSSWFSRGRAAAVACVKARMLMSLQRPMTKLPESANARSRLHYLLRTPEQTHCADLAATRTIMTASRGIETSGERGRRDWLESFPDIRS